MKTDYLSPAERQRLQGLITSKGAAWVAAELHVHVHDVQDLVRGDDVEEDLVDDARRLLARG